MANKYGRQRRDINSNHRPRKYKSNYDETGKKAKENIVLRSFWRENKMADIIKLTVEELDKVIDSMLANYQDRQLKNDPNWWYPELDKKTINELRYKKKLDKEYD